MLGGERLIELEQVFNFAGKIYRVRRRNAGLIAGFGKKQHVGDHPAQALEFLGIRGQHLPVLLDAAFL